MYPIYNNRLNFSISQTNNFFTCVCYKCQIEQILDVQLKNNLHVLLNMDVVDE
jgi:hypothetical protein